MRDTNAWDGQEKRAAIGLQFFAEDGMDWDGDDMDDGADDDLFWVDDDDDLTDQQADGADEPEEEEADSQANQPAGTQDGAPAGKQGQQAQAAPQTQLQQEAMTDIRYNGQTIRVPQAAMQAISGALGQDAVALIQKGMNYERRGAREIALIGRLAEAAGTDLAGFMQQAEAQIEQVQLERARQEVAATLPAGTPKEAIERLAQQRLSEQRAAREVEAFRARQQQNAKAAREQQEARARTLAPWQAYIKEFGIQSKDQIPAEVLEMVRGGMDPTTAHYKHLYEQEKTKAAAAQQNARNRQTAVGSVQGSGMDEDDPFLRGLLGD